jgi:putative tryptophan/tyrosine transport system substrate-binding protein
MRRRDLIALLGGTALTVPLGARAQPAPSPARIGYLGISTGPLADQFLAGVREGGFIEGQNLSVERREYAGNIPRLAEFATELVRLKVDAIFATGPGPVRAVANATHDIPLVAIDLESDPVEAGWAASLARPGGNITGVFLDLPELIGKWLEFGRELLPKLSRVAALWDPETGGAQVQAAKAAAQSLGVEIEILEVRVAQDLEGRFAEMVRARPDMLIQLSSPLIHLQSAISAEFALTNRIPGISLFSEFSEAGGLISYGPDVAQLYRRCGVYLSKVLKGAKPGELPIERPSRFVFVLNLKTAKAFGLPAPPSLLAKADEVIE